VEQRGGRVPTVEKHVLRAQAAPFGFAQQLSREFYFRASAFV
jgi:hypothetical protein